MKPILFSTPMVQAILDGRKTMTRRAIKDLPDCKFYEMEENPEVCYDGDLERTKTLSGLWATFESDGDYAEDFPMRKAAYRKGDILWVRETWGNWSYDDPDSNATYFTYFADYPDGAKTFEWPEPDEFGDKIICDLPKRRPSIFMPREACRLYLRVTDVKVERVQDIREDDAIREGCSGDPYGIGMQANPRDNFRNLWNEINAKRGYGWETNPFVWVISFERTEKPT